MENVEFCLYFYALGVAVAALIIAYDLHKSARGWYVLRSDWFVDFALFYMLSWLFVSYRFAVWLIDFLTYWSVLIVFKYKMWKIKNSNNNDKK